MPAPQLTSKGATLAAAFRAVSGTFPPAKEDLESDPTAERAGTSSPEAGPEAPSSKAAPSFAKAASSLAQAVKTNSALAAAAAAKDDAIELADADLAEGELLETPSQSLVLKIGGLALLVGAVIALVVLIRGTQSSSDGTISEPVLVTAEERLLQHLGGSGPPAPGRFEVAVADESTAQATLYLVRDGQDPTAPLRPCAVLREDVLCPSNPAEWGRVLQAVGVSPAADAPDAATWTRLGAWALGVDIESAYGGNRPQGNATPTTLVLALSPSPLPGLDPATVAEMARSALDHLRPGDRLIVLADTASGWAPMLTIDDASDWGAAQARLATVAWPSSATSATPPLHDLAGRRLHIVAVQGPAALRVPAAADLVPAGEPAAAAVSLSAVAVGGEAGELLTRAVFENSGRIYTLTQADGLPEAVGQEVARLTGRLSPLEPPWVGLRPDGGVAVTLFAPIEGGWRRLGLLVDADGAFTPVTGAIWREGSRSHLEASPAVPALAAGDWMVGALTSSDPTGLDGLAIDRLRLAVDQATHVRIELESDVFQPRLSVLPTGGGNALATQVGEQHVALELDLEVGQYAVAIQSADPTTGPYRVRAMADAQGALQPDRETTGRSPRDDRRGRDREAENAREEAAHERATSEADLGPPPVTSNTSLSDEDLRTTMRRVIPDMTDCADGYHGAVTFRFTVERGGRVRSVTAEGDGLSSQAATCLRDLVLGVRFSGYGGPEVTASYFAAF